MSEPKRAPTWDFTNRPGKTMAYVAQREEDEFAVCICAAGSSETLLFCKTKEEAFVEAATIAGTLCECGKGHPDGEACTSRVNAKHHESSPVTDKPWNVDRLVGEFNNWDCHQSDSCDCPHKYCDTYCSGKVADQCQAEFEVGIEDKDVPGCHPDTCDQVQLDGLLAVVKALLELPGARDAAEEALQKHWGDEDALRIANEQDALIEQGVLWRCICGTCCSVADDQTCPCGKSRATDDPRPEDPDVLAKLVVAELHKHLIWAEACPASVRKGEILVPYRSRINARTIQAYAVTDPRLAGMGVNAIAKAIMDEQRADLAEWGQR